MAYSVKVCTKSSYRRKNFIAIAIIALLAVIAVALGVYNLVNGKIWFVVSYLIAALLCVVFVVIRSNTVYSTYIAADKRSVYMRRWINGFMPYSTKFPIAVLREFIPAKTELIELPISDISAVYIGTKNFIKRSAVTANDFAIDVEPFEKSKDFTVKRTVQSMDIFYAETFDGEVAYMPVVEFGVKPMLRLLKHINLRNKDTEFYIYSRAYKRFKPVEVKIKTDEDINDN